MKTNIFRTSILLMLSMFVLTMTFTACSEDSTGGQPVITGVKVLSSDTLRYDYNEYYTKAGCGTLLAIMGNNLSGARKVFVNGQELTFNSTMNTDNNLIVQVPTEDKGFKLSAFDEVPDEIRVVTPGGEATFSFKITAPGPQIQRVAARYPRLKGDAINVYGKNLVDIEKVYFTDITKEELDSTTWTTVGGQLVDATDIKIVQKDHQLNTSTSSWETISQVSFVMPDVPYDEGCIVFECAAGTVYTPYYRRPGMPEITSINTDMPVAGSNLVIRGREFVQVETITYGDVTLTSDQFEVAETEDAIIVPITKKPTEGSGTTLTVTTPGGSATVEHFFDYGTLMLTFEDGFAADNGWSPAGVTMAPANGTDIPFISDGQFYRIKATDGGSNWWGTMCYFRKDWNGNSLTIPSFDIIPASTPASEVYLAVEIWNNNTIFGVDQFPFIHYQVQTVSGKTLEFANWKDGAYIEKPLHAIDGTQPMQQWYRAVMPLSNFSEWTGKTYGDIAADGFNQLRLMHQNRSSKGSTIDIMLDNVRIIHIPASAE